MFAKSVIDRSLLRFVEEVKKRFLFLESLGFRCVCSEPTFVRFESSKIGINIFHGRHSFEIDLEIETVSSPKDVYSFSELLQLVNKERGEQYKCYATHTTQGVAEGVEKLAKLFQRCNLAEILSNEDLFTNLKLQKKDLTAKYAFEIELRQARRKSEVAWHKKDYASVVKALKPVRAALTATEVGKLEFAESQMNQQKTGQSI